MSAEIPWRWEEAYVIPLSKRLPLSDPGNIRRASITLSLTVFFCWENRNTIDSRSSGKQSIIPSDQRGFSSSNVEGLNYCTAASKHVDIIFFDALDKVLHNKLLRKLSQGGVYSRIIKLVKDPFIKLYPQLE